MTCQWPCIAWPLKARGSVSYQWRGRREEKWQKAMEEEEKNGARVEGRHAEGLGREALGGVKMKNKTVGMRFDWAPGLPLLHKMAYEKMCFYSGKASAECRFTPILAFLPAAVKLSSGWLRGSLHHLSAASSKNISKPMFVFLMVIIHSAMQRSPF